MKARLFTLAAVAATTLLSQGVAQSDSLERSLADLNSGLVAPAGNAGVTWGGDFRLRNDWADNGDTTNNRDFDTRLRLTAAFAPTEDSSVFIGFNGSEAWGSAPLVADPEGDDDWTSGSSTATRVDRAYASVNNLMGDGGTMKAGRDYYTYGSGNIIGSSDWGNNPSAQSGVWYSHDMGGLNMNFAMMNTPAGETGNGANNPDNNGDNMFYVLSMDYALEAGALGTINLTPYAMRDESMGSRNWQGASLSGELASFGYDAEYTQFDSNTGSDGTAWSFSTSIDLEAMASIPGIADGGIAITFSSADEGFQVSNDVVTHGVGGFADYSETGTWAGGKDITSFALNFSPVDGWDGQIALHETESAALNYTETDISLGHDFGGNVSGWFGYAMINDDAVAEDSATFWTTLSLDF
jgi:hypothetical protein